MTGGLVTSSSDGKITKPIASISAAEGDPYQLQSHGVSFGVDFQWSLAELWSLSAMAKVSYENNVNRFKIGNVNTDPNSVLISHDVLGLQMKRWSGSWYGGLQWGKHYEGVNFRLRGKSKNNNFVSERSSGWGALFGREQDNGIIINSSVEFFQGEYKSIQTDVFVFRLEGGYRFK